MSIFLFFLNLFYFILFINLFIYFILFYFFFFLVSGHLSTMLAEIVSKRKKFK